MARALGGQAGSEGGGWRGSVKSLGAWPAENS